MTTPDAPAPPPFAALGQEHFVSLTTFRRSGQGVSTPVWVAPYGRDLVVTTPAGSGKLKRLDSDPRVLLRPCTRFGKVDPDVVPVEAVAEVLGHDRDHPDQTAALRRKYGLEYRLVVGLEAVSRRRRGRTTERLILRITTSTSTGTSA